MKAKAVMVITLLTTVITIAPILLSGNEYIVDARIVGEELVYSNGEAVRLVPLPGISETVPIGISLLVPNEEYIDVIKDLGVKVKNTWQVTIEDKTGEVKTLTVVEPELIKVEVPISGSLKPGEGHCYPSCTGYYYSCINIAVSVSWTPSDQTLGIGFQEGEAL